MRNIIIRDTGNVTHHRKWDYVAHYEGDCEDNENQDLFGEGATPEEALKDFMNTIKNRSFIEE